MAMVDPAKYVIIFNGVLIVIWHFIDVLICVFNRGIQEVLWFVETLQLVSHLLVTIKTVIHKIILMCILRFHHIFNGYIKR